jgi:hypothetical protein
MGRRKEGRAEGRYDGRKGRERKGLNQGEEASKETELKKGDR